MLDAWDDHHGRGCSSSWELGELIRPVRDGPSACSVCVPPYGARDRGASWAPDLDALAFKAGLLDCTLQFPQGSWFIP